jgi:hypothetical protein
MIGFAKIVKYVISFFIFLFFLLDQKETKNQGHKNPSRSA